MPRCCHWIIHDQKCESVFFVLFCFSIHPIFTSSDIRRWRWATFTTLGIKAVRRSTAILANFELIHCKKYHRLLDFNNWQEQTSLNGRFENGSNHQVSSDGNEKRLPNKIKLWNSHGKPHAQKRKTSKFSDLPDYYNKSTFLIMLLQMNKAHWIIKALFLTDIVLSKSLSASQ